MRLVLLLMLVVRTAVQKTCLLSVTISPSYTKNDNWDALLEVKPHLSEGGGTDIAVETLMTF